VIDILSVLSVIGIHLSRLAEDLILWSTKEFDLIEIDDAYCTGSSLMPQKKNADVLELVRGYSGRLYGNLMSVLTAMKGLPLTYNRDMQLDKEPLFGSLDITLAMLSVLTPLMKSVRFNNENIKKNLEDESLYATDLVYYLVRKNVPFKKAHYIVGELVKFSVRTRTSIKNMSDKKLKTFSDKFAKADIAGLFDPEASVRSKRSIRR
jgi:argininosuccinate lyase